MSWSATQPRAELASPALRHASVTPSDTVNLPGGIARALRIGTGGVIAVVDPEGTAIEYTVSNGEVLEVSTLRVNNTNTTASGIVAWY